MTKILITGNSGYIGSHLTQLLKKNSNYELHGLDKQVPQISVDKFILQNINWTNHWNIDSEYDCVIHLAAEVSVSESVQNPILYYQTNTTGTLNVLKNIKTKKFIHASTGAAGPMNNPYGISKRAAEEIVEQFCAEKSIPYTIFRFYNVVGSDGIKPTNPDGLFFNLMKAKETGKFKLFGDDYNTPDGSCIRDYVHVNEICNSLKISLNSPSMSIENLGHGSGTSVKQMIEIFKRINDCDFETIVCPRRDGDLEYSVLDNPSQYMQKLYSIEDLLKL